MFFNRVLVIRETDFKESTGPAVWRQGPVRTVTTA